MQFSLFKHVTDEFLARTWFLLSCFLAAKPSHNYSNERRIGSSRFEPRMSCKTADKEITFLGLMSTHASRREQVSFASECAHATRPKAFAETTLETHSSPCTVITSGDKITIRKGSRKVKWYFRRLLHIWQTSSHVRDKHWRMQKGSRQTPFGDTWESSIIDFFLL